MSPAPIRNPVEASSELSEPSTPVTFCHSFDLTKRLSLTHSFRVNSIDIGRSTTGSEWSFHQILTQLNSAIKATSPDTVHRIIAPSFLSPAVYPSRACCPTQVLPFLHSLRSLIRRPSHNATIMLTLPSALYPRNAALTRWIEHLVDGVLELAPFPYRVDVDLPPLSAIPPVNSKSKQSENKPQGIFKIHKLPILTEKGGGSGAENDLAFSLNRKRFVIVPYHLPPVDGDSDAQQGESETNIGLTVKAIEF